MPTPIDTRLGILLSNAVRTVKYDEKSVRYEVCRIAWRKLSRQIETGQLVTAPSEAEDTCRAYLAITPVV
jgi:hypothetical protein